MFAIGTTFFLSVLVFVRFRWATLFFAFMLPFAPRALSLAFGQGGLALSAQRLWVTVLFLALFSALFVSKVARRRMRQMVKEQKSFVLILCALILVKLLATLLYASASSLLYVIDDFLFSIVIFWVFYSAVRNSADFHAVLIAMVTGIVLSSFITLIELQQSAPVLSGLVDSKVVGLERVLQGRTRGGSFRVQALFDNPLQLAEFVCLSYYFAIFLALVSRGWKQYLAVAAILLGVFIIWNTGARSGLLALAAGVLIFRLALIWNRSTRITKLVLLGVVLALFAWAVYISAQLIVTIGSAADSDKLYLLEASQRSSIERASQYIIVLTEIGQSPVLGFGVQQNYEDQFDFLNNLDNYWLRVLLEGGFTALFFFGFLVVHTAKRIWQALSAATTRYDRLLYSAMLAFVGSFALMKFFLSMPTNNIYFYMVCGAFFASQGLTSRNAHENPIST